LSLPQFEFGLWLSVLPLLLGAGVITWLVTLPLRSVSIAAPAWSLMLFAAGVWYALGSDPRAPRLSPVLWLCALWAVRLSWHVGTRDAGLEERRLRELRTRHEPNFPLKSLYLVFLPQVLAAWVISLPLLGAFASIRPIGWLDHVAAALWLAGFTLEAAADWQLRRFRSGATGGQGVLDRGLWRYSRHPNYLGECCIWWGFWLFAAAAGAWWTLPAPLVLTWLLLRVSGIPGVEREAGNRRPHYADYVLKTNAFFPGRPRK
jgi:steroid 5-alpha reductase family enzyme